MAGDEDVGGPSLKQRTASDEEMEEEVGLT